MAGSTRLEPSGGWELDLLEFGQAEHPGDWVGPGFPEMMWSSSRWVSTTRSISSGEEPAAASAPGASEWMPSYAQR